MRISTLCVVGALALAGCGETTTSSTSPPARPAAEKPAPDNTGVNKRDADGATPTPIDQDENSRDVQITADIRKRVLDEADLSVNARNAKIITSEGKVTLRGPVASAEEKDLLGRIALSIAGDGNVTNLLEVAEP
jgi:hyperosmotically inducible protein